MNLNDLYLFLIQSADTLDQWAAQSVAGGWSTHQVEANRKMANEMRRRASQLLTLIK